MSAMEHINYTSIDIEYDLPLPIINFRSKQSWLDIQIER